VPEWNMQRTSISFTVSCIGSPPLCIVSNERKKRRPPSISKCLEGVHFQSTYRETWKH
jgi:hypothetical protein